MHRVILDTNIIVSALISDGYPSLIIEEIIFAEKAILCISEKVFSEYTSVLSRDKFLKYPEFKINADIVLSTINLLAEKYEPGISVNVITDEADNRLLELAIAAKADYLITGNIRHFKLSEFEGTKIISPKNYFDLFG